MGHSGGADAVYLNDTDAEDLLPPHRMFGGVPKRDFFSLWMGPNFTSF